MIDKKTGQLMCEDGTCFGRSLKRHAFLASEEGRESQISVQNEPWCSWSLPLKRISGLEFGITLSFCRENLNFISVTTTDPPNPWVDWSEVRERQRQKMHDQWLNRYLGNEEWANTSQGRERQFSWGEVFSVFDRKSGFSSIGIRYEIET